MDPAQHKTVVDAQNERVASEEAAAAAEEEGGAAEDGSNNDSDGAMEGQGKITIFEDASHSELRQRLAERISTLQSGRNAHLTKKTSQQKITASEKRKKCVPSFLNRHGLSHFSLSLSLSFFCKDVGVVWV